MDLRGQAATCRGLSVHWTPAPADILTNSQCQLPAPWSSALLLSCHPRWCFLCCLLPRQLNKLLLFQETKLEDALLRSSEQLELHRSCVCPKRGIFSLCGHLQVVRFVRRVVEVLLTESGLLEFCFSLGAMLFGENTSKSCLLALRFLACSL